MGMGEPLDNFENLLHSITNLQEFLSISPRRITLSTCGLSPKIKLLADNGFRGKLAVSLISADQKKRKNIMPIAKKYPLEYLKNSLIYFGNKTKFRVTFEYVMIKDFNMHDKDILALTTFLKGVPAKLNLITYNHIKGEEFCPPSEKEVGIFYKKLLEIPMPITIRKSRGADIDGACGQLKGKEENKKKAGKI